MPYAVLVLFLMDSDPAENLSTPSPDEILASAPLGADATPPHSPVSSNALPAGTAQYSPTAANQPIAVDEGWPGPSGGFRLYSR
jgi:hypothetical protein